MENVKKKDRSKKKKLTFGFIIKHFVRNFFLLSPLPHTPTSPIYQPQFITFKPPNCDSEVTRGEIRTEKEKQSFSLLLFSIFFKQKKLIFSDRLTFPAIKLLNIFSLQK